MPRRLCVYVVKVDTGFAPNPFGGYCTLAACTPNRRGIRFERGDWLVGHSAMARGQRLVYAMRISDVLDFYDYYRDPRFAAKKPRYDRGWEEACGDNLYHQEGGGWVMDANPFHDPAVYLARDTRNPRVFISDHYFYFGENAPHIPAEFRDLIWGRQGCRCHEDQALIDSFTHWVESNYAPGLHGTPADRPPVPACASRAQLNPRVALNALQGAPQCAPERDDQTKNPRPRC